MKYAERFQIYVLRIPNVAAGAILRDIPKQLDAEAPFILRGRQIRVQTTASVGIANLQNISTQWKNAWGLERSNDFIPVTMDMGPNAGAGGCPGPVYPQMVYPAASVINTNIQNNDANALDVSIYFWGVKLFPLGSIDSPTYPQDCTIRAYRRQVTVSALMPTETRNGILLKVAADADYVFRSGQCNNVNQTVQNFSNCFLTISDKERKPYMDAPVDVLYLFGHSNIAANIQNTGNFTPGLIVPELYVRQNEFLYFDFKREDGAIAGAVNNDVQVVFNGSKVFP